MSATEYATEAILLGKGIDEASSFSRPRAFELDYIDHAKWANRMSSYWHYSIHLCLVYIVTIFGIQRYMRDRPKFHLRGPLVAWNLFLCLFSMVGAIRSCLSLFSQVSRYGIYPTLCDKTHHFGDSGSALPFWGVVFVLSKIPELGDTIFIVLRKQKLIFLHWYHHATVLVYCFHSHGELASTSWCFSIMNMIVHTFMYLYYAIRAAGYRLPRPISIAITTLQISQMIGGCLILGYTYSMKSRGVRCDVSDTNFTFGTLMYISYLILFAKFFYDAYICRPTPVSKKLQKKD